DMHNTEPEMQGYGNGFIHQAGMYINPGLDPLNNKPFNSPLLAEAFDAENRSYSVINWGLCPTPAVNRTDALFYTKYRHWGDGVLEIIYYFYNFGTFDIEQPTTPWTGLRGSVYGTQILGASGGGFDVFPYDYETRRYNLVDTGGWIGHTEDSSDTNSAAYSLVQGLDQHYGQQGYEGQGASMNGYNLDTGGWRIMATDMHCNLKPGEGIFYRFYMTMGTLGDVAAISEQLVDNVDYGWLEFDEATAEFLPLYETTVSSQTILTTEVNGSPVAYSYAVPVKNSLPLFQMKEISSGTYVLSTDPYLVCSKKPFKNLYDPGDPESKYSTYQNRVVYRPYDENTEWIGLLGYVVPTALATEPNDCQPLSEILGEQIVFDPGEKQDSDELLIWTTPDTTAPTPDPATFSSAPSADNSSAISMTATTGSDATGPVEYYFAETTFGPGSTDSGWQTSPSYTDSGLTASTQYTYTVQMRDSATTPNVGTVSSGANATTNAPDTSAPTPNPATFASAPSADSSSAI
ncbi:hypothetical protein LCGC14_2448680, partial [marine sediment metagenome]